MARRTRAALLVPVLLAAALTGCGSTLAPSGVGTSGVAGPGTPGAPLDAGGQAVGHGATGAAGAGAAPGSAAADPGAQRLAAAGPGQAGGRASTTGSSGGTTGAGAGGVPGLTATEIRVGVLYFRNYDQANSDNGGRSVTGGDLFADATVMVRDVNAHGGLAGRRLVPVFVGYDKTSTASYAAQDQQACAALTQDTTVFAVLGAGLTPNLASCVERAGELMLSTQIVHDTLATFRQLPNLYDLQALPVESFSGALVATLVAQSYFTGWDATTGGPGSRAATVGVLTYDTAAFHAGVDDVLVPALARAGHPVTPGEIAYIADPASTADEGPAAAALQNAVLRFRAAGVDHLVVLDDNGALSQLLLTYAESQHYRPRYSYGSGSGLETYLEGGLIPPAQLAGAVGLGWLPMLDLSATDNPDNGAYAGPARRSCLALMRAGGQSFTSSNAQSIALLYCDEFRFLVRVVGSNRSPSRDGFNRGVAGLGTGFDSASLAATSFSADKHTAPARAWAWEFQSACTCLRYVGTAQPL